MAQHSCNQMTETVPDVRQFSYLFGYHSRSHCSDKHLYILNKQVNMEAHADSSQDAASHNLTCRRVTLESTATMVQGHGRR